MTGKDKLLESGLAAFKKHDYNGIALIPTGAGKGKLMIECTKILNPPSILYLCDRTILRDKMFVDELHKWDASYLLPRIERVCYQTAYKWEGRHFPIVLGDEFDAALTPKYMQIFSNNTFDKKILVSATLDDEKRRLAKKIAPIIFEVKPQDLIRDKVLNNVQFYFINYDLSPAENYKYLEYNKEFKVLLSQYQDERIKVRLEKLQIQRKHFLSSLPTSVAVTKWLMRNLEKRNEKILVFCGLSEQADAIHENSYHSINDNELALRRFETGESKELIVVDKITRGVNIAEVRNIIMESIGRSKTKMTQRIGRGMRLDVNDTLNVFFLVPHFTHPFFGRKPTIVQQWVLDSTKDMDLSQAKTIIYK